MSKMSAAGHGTRSLAKITITNMNLVKKSFTKLRANVLWRKCQRQTHNLGLTRATHSCGGGALFEAILVDTC